MPSTRGARSPGPNSRPFLKWRWLPTVLVALTTLTCIADSPVPDAASEKRFALPLAFEANRGQAAAEVRYLMRSGELDLFLSPTGAVFVPSDARPQAVGATRPPRRAAPALRRPAAGGAVRMRFTGLATRNLEPEGIDPRPGVVNYLIGRDPTRWRAGVPTFGAVRYENVWNGIDVVFHTGYGHIEYDFLVASGVGHEEIEFVLDGADAVALDGAGNLEVRVGERRFQHVAPDCFQERGGVRVARAGRFVLRDGNRVGFDVENRDPNLELVIDPKLVNVTTFGGSDLDNVIALAVAEDGSVIVGGHTSSTDFAGVSPRSFQSENQSAAGGGLDGAIQTGVIAKLGRDGKLKWATYLGGNVFDRVWGVRVDSRGFVYAAGQTLSPDLPTTANAFDRTYEGPSPSAFGFSDAFLAVLTPDGSDLVYSTYLGGAFSDILFSLDLLADPRDTATHRGGPGRGRLLMAATGSSFSSDFPLVNAKAPADSNGKAVVVVVDPIGGGLVYSSAIPGGWSFESGGDIAAVGDRLVVSGFTRSVPLPELIAWHEATEGGRGVARMRVDDPAWAGGGGYGNGFNQLLTKNVALPSGAVSATFLARWETEAAFDFLRFRISLDAGQTWETLAEFDDFSAGFEQVAVDLSLFAGRLASIQFQFFSDGFVSDEDGGIDTEGSAVDWIEISGLGRDEFDAGLDGWVASDGLVVFPSDSRYGPLGGSSDAFVAVVDPFSAASSSIPHVATIGGSSGDEAQSVAVAPNGGIFVSGLTTSSDLPTSSNAYQPAKRGFQSLWIAQLKSDLSDLRCATYLGGSGAEFPNGLDVDERGRPIVTGITFSTDYPLVRPFSIGAGGERDVVVSALSRDCSRLLHSSTYGGPGWDLGASSS